MITAEDVQTMIKTALASFLPKEANTAIWAVSKQVAASYSKAVRAEIKAIKSDKAKEHEMSNSMLQEFIDNPMDEEQESKALKAIYHMGLSTGNLSPQMLEKIDKIIGVGTGKDEEIHLVDFSDAFPNYEEAIRICGQAQPKVCKCGGACN